MLKRERERKRGRKWVMIAQRQFIAKKRLQLRCVFPEWILCVVIEIDISQRKTGTAASPLHISRMDFLAVTVTVLCTRNEKY